MEKLNRGYKPLIVAVFLVVGGLAVSATLLSKSGTNEQRNAPGAPFLLPSAHGAELDSAAVLKVQNTPFLTSGGANNESVTPRLWTAAPAGAGTLEDPRNL